MFSKLTFVALISVAVAAPQHQPAAQFPAGVDPSKCPNFPICDNALLHNPNAQPSWGAPQPSWNQPQPSWNPQPQQWNPQPQPQWNQPQPQWNQPQPQQSWNPAPYQAPSNHLPGAGGDKYPAGVNPQSCPNYPFCDGAAGHGAVAAPPLPGWSERQYPAGVSPHSCPNFPYCN